MSARSETILKSVIESSLREGESHLKHIHRASSILSRYFPLTEGQLNSFPDDVVPVLDQFIYRFTKLQDSMAGRLLPALDSLLRADDSPRPFLDVLSYLEQVGALPSENEWQFFRELRNNLAHDYPESRAQTVTTLNTLFERWHDLEDTFAQARDYYRSR